MIQPLQFGTKWILIRNLRWIDTKTMIACSEAPEKGRASFPDCWTGNGWSPTAVYAKQFDSSEEAARYLEQNRQRMGLDGQDRGSSHGSM